MYGIPDDKGTTEVLLLMFYVTMTISDTQFNADIGKMSKSSLSQTRIRTLKKLHMKTFHVQGRPGLVVTKTTYFRIAGGFRNRLKLFLCQKVLTYLPQLIGDN